MPNANRPLRTRVAAQRPCPGGVVYLAHLRGHEGEPWAIVTPTACAQYATKAEALAAWNAS